MSGILILFVSIGILVLAYLLPGTRLAKRWGVHKEQAAPGFRKRDDMDYIPAQTPVLLGHHFSSIAGIGFLAGTIQAASFGWLPALLWILFGGIFFGALLDFSSLFLSVRNQGKSIGTVMKKVVSRPSGTLVLIFSWVCLVVFSAYLVDVAGGIFAGVERNASGELVRNAANGSVAMAAMLFIALAVMFGFINRARMNLAFTTVMGALLLAAAIWIGVKYPIFVGKNTWMLLLLVYVFLAAVAPVWALLQPKDYLSSILFFVLILAAVAGICLARPTMEIPAFTNWMTESQTTIFPALFLFLSTGTMSGIHSLVASGTTSKQVKKETQMKKVGYGSMLLICLVCVIALVVVGSSDLPDGSLETLTGEDSAVVRVFARGIAGFFASVGLGKPAVSVVRIIVLLIIGTLAMTSLDTVVRVARYLFQELFTGENGNKNFLNHMYTASFFTVLMVGILSFGGYRYLWRLFDGANLLLAAMMLVGISCWMRSIGKKHKLYYLPIAVMVGVAWSDLGIVFLENMDLILSAGREWAVQPVIQNVGISFMMILSVLVLTDGIKAIFFSHDKPVPAAEETAEEEPVNWEEEDDW
ncbi:MAG: carbon starvation protein A [Blautia sp.]|jgi:carbon starvation protein